MSSKKVILWDMGKVLVNFDYELAFKNLAKNISPLTAMMLWAKKDEFMRDFKLEIDMLEAGKMQLPQLFTRLKGKIGLKMDYEPFVESWNCIFDVREDVMARAIELSEKYDSYLLSNTNKEHFDYILKTWPEIKFVKGYALSHEMGLVKPSAEFFEKALEKFNLSASDCIFIDDIQQNVEAAEALGIESILFKNVDQLSHLG